MQNFGIDKTYERGMLDESSVLDKSNIVAKLSVFVDDNHNVKLVS